MGRLHRYEQTRTPYPGLLQTSSPIAKLDRIEACSSYPSFSEGQGCHWELSFSGACSLVKDMQDGSSRLSAAACMGVLT